MEDFTGRDGAVGELVQLMAPGPDGAPARRTVVITAVAGKPGVGKTALAVHVAHRLRDQFPDGQLYVNLRGSEAEPRSPGGVLGEFLRALGAPDAAVPAGRAERAALYRALLADRRVLIVLDNAAGEAQVRPLLPGTAGCVVVVTSRTRLTGLEAAHLVDLDVLSSAAAMDLLAKVAGQQRARAEPEAARQIAGYCGCLPLAIRIAGARLAARPHWRLARLAERLAAEHRRLDELAAGDRAVRASFTLSYQEQDDDIRRAFRRLTLVPGTDFAAWVAAPLLAVGPAEAEHIVERLAEAQLLEAAGEDGTGQLRYRYHDLLRLFARERLAEEETGAARRASLRRLITAYVTVAALANAGLPFQRALCLAGTQGQLSGSGAAPSRAPRARPELRSLALALTRDPLAWLSAENMNLVGAVEQAHRARLWALAYGLALNLSQFYDDFKHYADDWQQTHELALDAARRAGDRQAEATVLHNLAMVYREQGRWDDARDCLENALLIFGSGTDEHALAVTLHRLGGIYRYHGEWPAATAYLTRALTLFHDLGDRRWEGTVLRDLGIAARQQGRLADAIGCHEKSLSLLREAGDQRGQAHVLHALGDALTDRHQLDQAIRHLEEAVRLARASGDQLWELYSLGTLGRAYGLQNHVNEALRCFTGSLPFLRARGFRRREAIICEYQGETYQSWGRLAEARACFEHALPIFRAIDDRPGEARTLRALGLTQAALGHPAAEATLREALTLLDATELPQAEEIRAHLASAHQRHPTASRDSPA